MLGQAVSPEMMAKISRFKIGEENGVVTLYLRDENEQFTSQELQKFKYALQRWYDIISFRREDRLIMVDMKPHK